MGGRRGAGIWVGRGRSGDGEPRGDGARYAAHGWPVYRPQPVPCTRNVRAGLSAGSKVGAACVYRCMRVYTRPYRRFQDI